MQSHKNLLFSFRGEMVVSKLPGILVALVIFVTGGFAQQNGGTFECKPNSWTPGASARIEFRIDRSKFPSLCAGGTSTGQLSFRSSPDGTTYTAMCTVSTNIQSSCSFVSGTTGCGCTDDDDSGFYVVEYNFVATANTDRWWEPFIDCNDASTGTPALSFTTNCKPFPIDTTTAAATTTVSQETTSDNGGYKTATIVLGIVAALAVGTTALLAVVLLKKKSSEKDGGGRDHGRNGGNQPREKSEADGGTS